MKSSQLLGRVVVVAAMVLGFFLDSAGAADGDEDLIQLIVNLLGEQDQDLRALAFEQVRTEAKSEAATRRFAEQLPKLSAEAQVGLLRALADRGDQAARPAVLELLRAGGEEPVRLAAIGALGSLGLKADLPVLVRLLAGGSKAEQQAARTSLVRIRGEAVPAAIAAELKQAKPALRVALIEVLAERRAVDAIPDLLAAATDDHADVRVAAMTALGEMAATQHIADMVRGVLKAKPGAERDAAEKAVMFVAARIPDQARRADPLLAAMEKLNDADQTALLPALGRIGGPQSLKRIETAIADGDSHGPGSHDAGIRALTNWPNASVAERLVELARSDKHEEHRAMALAALIRVAPLPDGRPDPQRLALVRKVMEMAKTDAQRNLMLRRASAVRTVETLRFLLPYLDQPRFAEQAAESIVELAHHRGLREPNKAEFHRALDRVIATSKDAVVIERANRYKRDQTWVRPKS